MKQKDDIIETLTKEVKALQFKIEEMRSEYVKQSRKSFEQNYTFMQDNLVSVLIYRDQNLSKT